MYQSVVPVTDDEHLDTASQSGESRKDEKPSIKARGWRGGAASSSKTARPPPAERACTCCAALQVTEIPGYLCHVQASCAFRIPAHTMFKQLITHPGECVAAAAAAAAAATPTATAASCLPACSSGTWCLLLFWVSCWTPVTPDMKCHSPRLTCLGLHACPPARLPADNANIFRSMDSSRCYRRVLHDGSAGRRRVQVAHATSWSVLLLRGRVLTM